MFNLKLHSNKEFWNLKITLIILWSLKTLALNLSSNLFSATGTNVYELTDLWQKNLPLRIISYLYTSEPLKRLQNLVCLHKSMLFCSLSSFQFLSFILFVSFVCFSIIFSCLSAFLLCRYYFKSYLTFNI